MTREYLRPSLVNGMKESGKRKINNQGTSEGSRRVIVNCGTSGTPKRRVYTSLRERNEERDREWVEWQDRARRNRDERKMRRFEETFLPLDHVEKEQTEKM